MSSVILSVQFSIFFGPTLLKSIYSFPFQSFLGCKREKTMYVFLINHIPCVELGEKVTPLIAWACV